MNNWSFTGNLGKDCEIKSGQNGNRVVFSVAVKSGYGENEKTTWANCVIFGKRADGALPQHLVSGQKVAITGEVTEEKWQNSEGVQKSAVKVIVNSLDLIGGGQKQQTKQSAPVNHQPNQAQPQQRQVTQSQPQSAQTKGFDDFDSDIPF